MAAIWRTTIPQMGFTHHYLLQLALALSAFQLARQQPERAAYLRNLAGQYQDAAVQRVTALLPGMNRDNCDQLYVAAVLISSLSFASGPTPGEYLLISDKGASGWLVLNRGARAILELQKEILFSGRLSVMFRIAARRLRTAFASGPLPTICEEARTFRSYLVGLAVTEPNINTYLEAFDRLLWTLKGTMDAQEIGEANDSSMFLFSWIYCLEENFILCLQQHQPLALVILSYFTVMVYHCRTSWFIEGWSEHIMTGIHRLIPEEYKPWIRWPSKQVGWVE
ncbi:hypothetical protein MPH_10098 [Macrophomina phaseolina MS6]|uniref:C6 transcription factor n=1 Tax=Macrophomina phaseolina (strain MS6) TaxID=1126212 RepID=K2S7L0_MACPH|nr:hypothetical protein MPH_10098 [Macrophomina phaseolina MS6]